MFFLNENDEYLEVELGPWGQHLLLLLQGERNAIKDSLPLDYIVTEKTDPVGSTPVSVVKMVLQGKGKKGMQPILHLPWVSLLSFFFYLIKILPQIRKCLKVPIF